jgi:hypothetical protein
MDDPPTTRLNPSPLGPPTLQQYINAETQA